MKGDWRRFAFRVAVAVVAVVALLYGVGWERVLRNLQDANPVLFALAPLSVLLALLAGAEGTRLALDLPARGERASLARRASLGATIVRVLLPAGNVGGSGFVAYTVSRHGDVSVSEALAGVTSWEFVMTFTSATVCIVALTPHSLAELTSALVLNRGGTLAVQIVVGGGVLWTLDAPAIRDLPTP